MIEEVRVEQRERWDKLVRSFSDYDVYYLNGYVVAFMEEDEGNGEPILLYYENGEERAITVLFRRDVALEKGLDGKVEKGKYFDLITPYGYGGFLGNIVDYDALNACYRAYCVERGYVCEFTRFGLFTEYHRYYDGFVESRTHNVVRSLDLSLDDMWMDFKQKVRKNVKRATQNGLEILIENTDAHLKEFLEIYYGTMERNDAEQGYYFSEKFYRRLLDMKENIMFFHVLHEGKVISTELVIYGAEHAYSYLGGTNREYFELRPNDFLKWEIIKWAKQKGLKTFVLGGGYGADDGIFQYKTCLAPNGIVDFYIGRRIFDICAYDMLCEKKGVESHSAQAGQIGFFPEYRARA